MRFDFDILLLLHQRSRNEYHTQFTRCVVGSISLCNTLIQDQIDSNSHNYVRVLIVTQDHK